ncbi:MAG: 16S rRNA (guanine(966)-N(2))-methyltransferase RsmD [Thermodesulfobacteriota bacterium]
MRIIAGKYKGKPLFSLRGKTTRPTGAKVREAIFNICGDTVADARVLDLFAGTGAFGIEALSRGADSAVFVDANKQAIDLIRKNIAACGADSAATVFCADIGDNLHCLYFCKTHFDLVFMDPPYRKNAIAPAIDNLIETGTLAPGAMVVIEHAADEPAPADKPCCPVTDVRRYGKTLVTFMRYMVEAEDNA